MPEVTERRQANGVMRGSKIRATLARSSYTPMNTTDCTFPAVQRSPTYCDSYNTLFPEDRPLFHEMRVIDVENLSHRMGGVLPSSAAHQGAAPSTWLRSLLEIHREIPLQHQVWTSPLQYTISHQTLTSLTILPVSLRPLSQDILPQLTRRSFR